MFPLNVDLIDLNGTRKLIISAFFAGQGVAGQHWRPICVNYRSRETPLFDYKYDDKRKNVVFR